MNYRRGQTHGDYRSWRSHDQDRGVQAASIHVAVADMDATYGAYAAAEKNSSKNINILEDPLGCLEDPLGGLEDPLDLGRTLVGKDIGSRTQ